MAYLFSFCTISSGLRVQFRYLLAKLRKIYVTVHGKTYVNDLGKCSLKSFVDRSLVVWNFYPFAKTF